MPNVPSNGGPGRQRLIVAAERGMAEMIVCGAKRYLPALSSCSVFLRLTAIRRRDMLGPILL